MSIQLALKELVSTLEGTLYFDKKMRSIYATDASIYRQMPLAVAYPKNSADIKRLIAFANENNSSLIPRAAGTSLAGQCVGDGVVVDISKHFTQILEINREEKWVRVQPGVVRDELNVFLEKEGFFFGPNTSTANRCMMGGMVGNNSSGTTSIKYGVTRDKVLEMHTILSDGSEAVFTSNNLDKIDPKGEKETQIYKDTHSLLSEDRAREEIEKHFPKKEIHRRNTGYAIDILAEQEGYVDLTKLLCGSEGTLAFTTELKLKVDDLPPPNVALVCAHFNSIKESMEGVLVSMKAEPFACELMDKIILDCTRNNVAQSENRFFVEGDPAAVLVTELRDFDQSILEDQVQSLVRAFKESGLGYAFTVVKGVEDANKVWSLRAAGLGLMSNIPGDAKPIACIEDTAVDVNDLPQYISEFESLMESFEQEAVYYAHAGAGELHLRPIINLKEESDRIKFRRICEASAHLVKKYNGSLSGEHGDGRVRAEFIPLMVGENNYKRLQRIKQIWDPSNIFNPGKIVDAAPIDEDLRYKSGQKNPVISTVFDFDEGLLESAEKCNGSADCRKITGAMCPSYQATKDEDTTTRARANMLREVLTENGNEPLPLASEDLKQVLDLCVSCKACKRECPSNVDMAMMKAEFLHQYHKKNGLDFRSKIFGSIHKQNKLGMLAPSVANFLFKNTLISGWMKQFMGVAPERSLPMLNKTTFRNWMERHYKDNPTANKKVHLFIDEFTDYNDLDLGIKTVELLTALGFQPIIVAHQVSGRTYISKGMLDEAKGCAQENVQTFSNIVSEDCPLVGIEPSAILSFRDEYPKLLRNEEQSSAKALAKNCFTIEEFLDRENKKESLSHFFNEDIKEVKAHVHCQQKAISKQEIVKEVLSIPKNYKVDLIKSGCCGMAGSFGYEKEHYEVSMKMGELNLFPVVRSSKEEIIIAASGTSCRHQIADGTQRKALHPIEVLHSALG